MASVDVESGFHSPRISFSVYLSQADTIPEKRKREDNLNRDDSNTDFEFCVVSKLDVNGSEDSILADELFVEGAILPQIRLKEVNFAERKASSEVLSAAAPDSNPKGTRNNAAKAGSRPSGRWREIFKLSNMEYFCSTSEAAAEEIKDTREMNNNTARATSSISLSSRWPFTRSRSPRSGLFSSSPFSRSKSARECKSKLETSYCYRSKSVGTVDLCEDFKSAAKVKTSRRELRGSSENEGACRSFGDIYGEIYLASYRNNSGRFRVGNVEKCGAQAWKWEGKKSSWNPGGCSSSMKVAPSMDVATGGCLCFCARFCRK